MVKKGLCLFLLVFLLKPGGVLAQDMVFPGDSWETASSESQGVDAAKLNEAFDYLAAHPGDKDDGIEEAVVIRNGYLIWQRGNIDREHGIWSASKIFTSTTLGLLVDDGKCQVDDLAKNWTSRLEADYPTVKLSDFATMTSGYDAEGGADWGGGMDGSAKPWIPTDPKFPPGAAYLYWDDAMGMMGYVLTQMAQESMESLFKRRIADPIHIDPNKWDWKDYGEVDGIILNGGAGFPESGLHISAREIARLGHLFLNRGNWDGTQLISTNWVNEATQNQVSASIPLYRDSSYRDDNNDPHTDHFDIDGRGIYGYHWWTNGTKANGERNLPDAPLGTFYRTGYNHNMLFVIPEWQMVIARLGLDGTVPNRMEVWNEVLRIISEGIETPPEVDLPFLLSSWGIVSPGHEADLNNDQKVNGVDFGLFLLL